MKQRNLKKIASISLLSLIALFIGLFVHKEFIKGQTSEPLPSQDLPIADKDTVAENKPPTKPKETEATRQEDGPMPQPTKTKVIAYYFHGTYRCGTCLTMERYSREVMEKYFNKELQDKRLEFKALNVEEPENMHYDSDYELPTISLVIALYKNGIQEKWKNLRDIWTYVEDKEKFYQYVRDETGRFLEEAR